MKTIRRQHIHFPGFEPLTTAQHYRRFVKGAESANKLWNCEFSTSDLNEETDVFCIQGKGEDWNATTNVLIVEMSERIAAYEKNNLLIRLIKGYRAFFEILTNGALFGYFKHAWRFGFFAITPFLLIGIGLWGVYLLTQLLAFGEPLNMLWSLPVSILAFVYLYLPLCNKLHTILLFGDWEFTMSMAKLNDAEINAWLEEFEHKAKQHIDTDCDEILITTHSMGGSTGVHIIGALLEKNPNLFDGKKVIFSQLGGCVLQSALASPAHKVRSRLGLIAQNPAVQWLEIQCLSDAVSFYKTNPVAIFGFDKPDKPVYTSFIRFKHQLERPTYKRIKKDLLRMHRQYVLSSEKAYKFDFMPFVAGPYIGHDRLQRLMDEKPALD